ncbi:hypothetical protein [Phenylobacterium sp.]|jgi:hypothetical protein|uniref:hypothetical protein n=1 Tax=Phenylobacterium sp. TaxID=1871053 RepID=UPI002F40FEFB
MRASGFSRILFLLATLVALPAVAGQPQTPSEDNLGVRTEDGVRTTDPRYHQPQANIGGGGSGGAVGHPGSGSAAADALTNEIFNGVLAKAPLLSAAQNPLLGRWRTTGANPGMDLNSIGPLGQLSSGMLAGGCDSMFGKIVTFGPSSFERVGADGRAQVQQHVEYHGNPSRIAVLVKGSGSQPTIMSLSDPDHAVSAMGCTLQRDRSGGPGRTGGQALASIPGAQLANAPMPRAAPPPSGPANATLRFQVGISVPGGFTPLVNAPLWLMTQDPQAAYAATGLPMPQGVSLPAKLASDCRSLPVCQSEIPAIVRGALGRVMTDAQGHAQTPQIPSGRYYVVGVSAIQGKPVVWVQPVNVQPGANTLTLDQLNGHTP